jgi:hypothetical protein
MTAEECVGDMSGDERAPEVQSPNHVAVVQDAQGRPI